LKTKFKQTEIGMIPEDWEVKPLSEVIEIMGGGTPKTTNPEYWNGDIPWISVVDFVNENRWIHKTEKTITKKGLDESSTKLLHSGQLIISARGTVGEIGQVKKDMAFNQSCYGLDGKNGLLNDFLYYLLKYKIRDIQSKTHGSVFNTITRNTFDQIFIQIPEETEQLSISKILSDLDSKIELNQQMNKTLETIGQAIFKHWFVDFEFPNEQGKPYMSSGGEMIDSELCKIPAGWEFGKYSELVEVTTGKGLRREEFTENGEFPVIGANGELGRTNNFLFNEDLILTGRVGTLGTIHIIREKAWISDNVLISKTRSKDLFYYSYYVIKNFDVESLNRGSTQPLITQTDLKNQICLLPHQTILVLFNKILSSIFDKIFANYLQNKNLSQIRDSLLPKLMSGKIRVPIETS